MSKIYKCDRCKTIFTDKEYPLIILKYQLYIKRDLWEPEWSRDLCPKCNKELKEWIENVQS